ncbi:hypothetical protein GO755_29675 [Spirosoma sp. HMF4905]|uniref:Uncharacterized protein n=1 Tax=Spirosoma arboris TaxID=2682092 RepID=A0A7K1SKA3_9BACT|nr:hypothetical protein [Spirosoma arboris]MVM34237.1 hypothetical protein [Spirosoma arboris]
MASLPGKFMQTDAEIVNPDPAWPILRKDSRLTVGSLLLIDPSHSLLGLSAVPASGGVIPNIAWEEAAAILGSGTQASLSATVTNNFGANVSLFELTPKKLLHGIVSQTANTATAVYQIAQAAIAAYIVANPTHDFYYSHAGYISRAPLNANHIYMGLTSSQYSVNNIVRFQQTSTTAAGQSGVRNSPSVPMAPGYFFRNVAGKGVTGTLASPTNLIKWGSNNNWGEFVANQAPSWALGWSHIVDLTVAGLTYAQMDAIELAYYNNQLATGGRFTGDTFTAPSTLA